MAWIVDENGNVVWSGEGSAPKVGLPRFAKDLTPEERASALNYQTQLATPKPPTPPGIPRFMQDATRQEKEDFLRRAYEAAGLEYVPEPAAPVPGAGLRVPGNVMRPPAPAPPAAPLDLTGLFADTPVAASPGYRPSLVDTSAAEALLRYEQTPEERAALEQLLQDLDFRAEAGTTAVRTGWQDVQRINSAAADKAAQMARDAGPEASRLWIDAANTVLGLSAQAADVLGSTAGMQRVNISPSAGSERIAALLAAEAPRARQLAERMGMATSEQIASQARTAGMMGEAFAGDIQRTSLIQANNARAAHNAQVLARISEERQLGAQMRFNAAQTNAQLLSTAAAAATAGATSPSQRRDQVRNLVSDVRDFANIDPLEGEPRNGIAALMGIYGLDVDTARGLIIGAREGTINWAALMAEIEG